jgi:hypothetical protein
MKLWVPETTKPPSGGSENARMLLERLERAKDSNPRLQPWQGCALPLSYARARAEILPAFNHFTTSTWHGASSTRRSVVLPIRRL